MKAARFLRTYLWDGGCFWLLGLAGLKLTWVWLRLWNTAPDGGSSLIHFTWISLIVLLAPGLAFLRLAGYRDPSVLGRLVMIVSISLAISTAVVFQLYLLGIYHRRTLVCVLGIFALAGVWGLAGVRPLRALGEIRDAWRAEGRLERIGWTFFTGYLLLVFERSLGAPFVDWDVIVSWDRWGCDMAERHGLGGYLMGGYPHLIPTLYSIYYKMAGTHLVDVPDEQLLLHGLMGMFPLILLGGLIRFCRLIGVPWVVASILLFSSSHVYSRIANGYVDIPVTAFAVVAAAVVVGLLCGTWRCRHPGFSWAIVGLLLYAVGFAKGHGLLWIAALAAYAAVVLGRSNRLRLTWRPLLGCGLLAMALPGPFYAHQSHLARNPGLVETDPRLHTLPMQFGGPAVKRFSLENLRGTAYELIAGFDPRRPILRPLALGMVFGLLLVGGVMPQACLALAGCEPGTCGSLVWHRFV